MVTVKLPLSQEIACDYALIKLLGKGGIGEVYLAEQLHVGRRLVALKVLNHSFAEDPEMLSRFKNEAAIAGRLDHENVVKIHDCRITSDGQVYVAMEYVQGESLRDLLKRQGALPLPLVVDIARQVCAGLHAAHQLGVVHRDIKPDNIMLVEKDGRMIAKVLDFGIARFASPDVAQTTAGVVIGSAHYMSPEQAAGVTGEQIDARSDVYSLGMVVYELLTGRVAFRGDSWTAIVSQQRRAQPPAPRNLRPDIPPSVEAVILKALQKDRANRQQSALEFARELAASTPASAPTLIDGEVTKTRPQVSPLAANSLEPSPAMSSKKSKWWREYTQKTLVSIVAAVLTTLGGYWANKAWEARQERTLSYSITVQKYRDGKPYQPPFQLASEINFEKDYRVQLNLTSQQAGYFYVLNEGPEGQNKWPYNVLFPAPWANGGSAQIMANQMLLLPEPSGGRIGYELDGDVGQEKVWLIWAAQSVPELEAAKQWVFKTGEVQDADQTAAVRAFLAKHPPAPAIKDAQQTTIKGKGSVLVGLIILEHH